MYAVIRTGGKQYRVAPGDVVKIESVVSEDKTVEFVDVLAVGGEAGTVTKPATAKVTADVLGEGLDAQPLCIGVASVCGAASTLLMCHCSVPFSKIGVRP